jgi:hypothetical protein
MVTGRVTRRAANRTVPKTVTAVGQSGRTNKLHHGYTNSRAKIDATIAEIATIRNGLRRAAGATSVVWGVVTPSRVKVHWSINKGTVVRYRDVGVLG